MRDASVELIAAIAAEATTLCGLWDVLRADGSHLRFTDNDVAVTYDDGGGAQVYRADVSFNSSAVLLSSQFQNAQGVTIDSVLDDDAISEADVRSGRYRGATATLTVVDKANPEYGGLVIFKGTFGKITLSDKKRLKVELTPLSGGIQAYVAFERYQMTCRRRLGDSKCGVDIEALKVAFTVDSATGNVIVASELTQADNHWKLGQVRWLTGDNADTVSNVGASDQSSTNLTLIETPIFPIQVGDTAEVFPGCGKWLVLDCKNRFNNVLNFRGEPYVPQAIYYKAPSLRTSI